MDFQGSRSHLAGLVAALLVLSGLERTPPAAPLTTVRELQRALAPRTSRGCEVELRGTATYFDEEAGILYLQDGTGGMALDVGDVGARVVWGGSVLLTGWIDCGEGRVGRDPRLPRLHGGQLSVVAQPSASGTLLPRRVSAAALLAGAASQEWIEARGVVRSVTTSGSSLLLVIEEQGVRFRARVANAQDLSSLALVGARVLVWGVSAAPAHAERYGAAQARPRLLVPLARFLRIEEDPPGRPEPAAAASALPTLSTAAAVRRLSVAEADAHYPIRLQGVVTFNDPSWSLLFVEDRTAGIYVEAWHHLHRLRAGDRVLVTGESARGGFAPIVDRPRIRVLSHGPLPPARRVRPRELVSGALDSQRVLLEGMVRTLRLDQDGATLAVLAEGVRIPVRIAAAEGPDLAQRLVGARVEVRGVCHSLLTLGNQLAEIMVQVPDLGSLTVLDFPPADRFALPVRPVGSLLRQLPRQSPEEPVLVRGVVTYSGPGETYVQDETGSVRVHSGPAPPPAVGEAVDVVGFAEAGEYRPVLEDAQVRSRGRGVAPRPVAIRPEDALTGAYDGGLVSLEGRLLDLVTGVGEEQLLMRAGPYSFTAVLPGAPRPWTRPRAGSLLRLTGICTVGAGELAVPRTFRALVRSPDDVRVLRAAPWWNPRHALLGTSVLVGMVGLALSWVATLRRRVRAQSAVIWDQVKSETELRERQRMARELHDTLEQNLTGIGLSLEAARRALPEASPRVERHLALALEQVRGGIEEVRHAVWALRSHALDARGPAEALAEIGERLARCGSQPIAVTTRVEGSPRPLPVETENNLLRIGQEALTNAVRHAWAASIRVELRYDPESVQLRVSDDGHGLQAGASERRGHFGLQGMRERAQQMGARLELTSAPDRGTTVTVTVPLPRAG